MFVQWCIKGIAGRESFDPPHTGLDDDAARDLIDSAEGILCNWWRNASGIARTDVAGKLTPGNLTRHIHDYANFGAETPFISLTAGCVSREIALRLNRVHEAQDIALRFATDFGHRTGYLYYCWVIVGLNPAVEIESVAEEVRELHTYLSWSDYQLEGEVTAKIVVPATQIERCERWDSDRAGRVERSCTWRHDNPAFCDPASVVNLRRFL